jgi:arginine N-succinyltransferase
MLVVRAIQESDIDSLFELIQQSEFGLTTLKVSKKKLKERIDHSLRSFAQDEASPQGQPYVFVMEDMTHGKIVGTCAVYSKVGGFQPFYTYEIRKAVHESEKLGIRKEIDALHLKQEHDGPTEIGSLFLSPEYWGGGHGRMLSLSRFLFIADFPERFETEIIAEMRGVVNADGKSPMWAALGSHFFQVDFPKAETLSVADKKFIADLMPTHPIYIPLLPPEAQAVIGEVHQNTKPALALLKQEGFEYRGVVDIFDGGPAIHCHVENVRTIRESQCVPVADIVSKVKNVSRLLVSNGQLNFRCCMGNVQLNSDSIVIDEVTALSLKVKVGDRIRAVTLKTPQ